MKIKEEIIKARKSLLNDIENAQSIDLFFVYCDIIAAYDDILAAEERTIDTEEIPW